MAGERSALGIPCPACTGAHTEFMLHTDADVYACRDCLHVFSDPCSIANPERYGDDYYEQKHRNWFANPQVPLFDWILARVPESAVSLLDAGCGRGAFLRHARHRRPGLHLVGVDYAQNENRDGIVYHRGDLIDMPRGETFDAVVSLAVIEHVADPFAFARDLASRCNDGAVVITMTLDNGSLLYAAARWMAAAGMRQAADRLYSAHHLQHFTNRSLTTLLQRSGLEVLETLHHNASLAALDIPARNAIQRGIFTVGVAGLFALGALVGRTYLQTVVALKRPRSAG